MEKITDLVNILLAEDGQKFTTADTRKALACAIAVGAFLLIATAF